MWEKLLEKERWGARDLCKVIFAKLARISEVEMTGFLQENAVSGGFWRLLPEQKD